MVAVTPGSQARRAPGDRRYLTAALLDGRAGVDGERHTGDVAGIVGARFGPRGVREASTLFSFGHAGAYDHEDDVTYLEGVRILVGGIKDLRAERDALAKRVEELESFLTAWVAMPDDDFEPAKALWREALRIAERRAGRAK